MNRQSETAWLPLVRVADLPEGISGATLEATELVIVKKGDSLSVFAGRCLHQEAPLAQAILEKDHIVCSKHLWRYRLDSGALEGEPGIFLQKFQTRQREGMLDISREQIEELKALYASFDEDDDVFYQP